MSTVQKAVGAMALYTPSAPSTMPSAMPMKALLVSMLASMALGDIRPPSALLSAARNTV